MLPLVEDIRSLGGRMAVYALLFLLALVLLEKGADRFLDSTATVARRLHIPQILVALLTAGAEWEELAVVVVALAQGHPYLALGNVLGSCVANVLGSFSLGLLFPPPGGAPGVTVDRSAKIYSTIMAGVATLVAALAWGGLMTTAVGGVLLAVFAIYVGFIAYGIYRGFMDAPELSDCDSDSDSDCEAATADEMPEAAAPTEPKPKQTRSTATHIAFLLCGLAALSVAGWLLAGSSTAFAAAAGLSDSVVGLTLVSFATTLPEKVLAVMASRRGQSGVVVANTVGSIIFLLTLVLGIVLVSSSVHLDAKTRWFDVSCMLASCILCTVLIVTQRLLKYRATGLVMLVWYIAYIVANFFVGGRGA
ncbi:hypothetical protein RI367_007957 [Sorochytrium milnesiophthora]